MLGAEGLEIHSPAFKRQWLKEKILEELPRVKSVLQKNRRKPAVSLVLPCSMQGRHGPFNKEKPANTIQVSSNIDDVPSELYTMIRWITVGPVDDLQHEKGNSAVDRLVLTVSQNILYGFKYR